MKEVNRKKSLLILLSATLIIGVLVFVLLLFSARTFSIYMKDSPDGYTNIDAEYEHDGILKLESAVKEGNRWVVTFRGLPLNRVPSGFRSDERLFRRYSFILQRSCLQPSIAA